MPIRVTLDRILAEHRMKAKDLAQRMGISETQLSLFRSGKVRGIRFATLAAMCAVLECRPGDLIDYDPDPADLDAVGGAEEDKAAGA
jgi:putative transcriptional regulator